MIGSCNGAMGLCRLRLSEEVGNPRHYCRSGVSVYLSF
jgi:hypothetical protein